MSESTEAEVIEVDERRFGMDTRSSRLFRRCMEIGILRDETTISGLIELRIAQRSSIDQRF